MAETPVFRVDDLSDPVVRDLVARHLAGMRSQTPAGEVHALDIDALRGPEITFWSAWVGDELVGCGALKRLDAERGEVKSMRVEDAWLGQGIGRAILDHIIGEARRVGMRSLWLETGVAFRPARRLYERAGFAYTGPFDDYTATEFSVFMTLAL